MTGVRIVPIQNERDSGWKEGRISSFVPTLVRFWAILRAQKKKNGDAILHPQKLGPQGSVAHF